MASRRRDTGMEINLMPFLDVLACTIGCLLIMIVLLSLMQATKQGREPEELETAQTYVKLQKEQQEDEDKIEELKQLVETVVLLRQDINAKREELKRILSEAEMAEDVDAFRDEMIAELNRLKAQATQLEKDREEVLAAIEELKKQIKDRKAPPELPEVVVRPSGSGVGLQPYFIEVTSVAILIHRSMTEEAVRIPTASIHSSPEFLALVKEVQAAPNGQIIFLLRGDAIENYKKAKRVADAAEARNARLPLPGQGKINLKMFEKFLK